MDDIKAKVKRYVRNAGLAGFGSAILILTSATVRLPGTSANMFNGIAPFAGFELVHTKAELEGIMGPVGSEARKAIAERKWGPGFDFTFSLAIFIYTLCMLQRRFLPDQDFHTLSAMAMLVIALALEYFFVHRAATVADAARITEDMAVTLRSVGWIKWTLLLIPLNLCTFFLTKAQTPLRFGANIIRAAALLGIIAVRYMGLAVLAILVGVFGVSALFVFSPDLIFAEHGD